MPRMAARLAADVVVLSSVDGTAMWQQQCGGKSCGGIGNVTVQDCAALPAWGSPKLKVLSGD